MTSSWDRYAHLAPWVLRIALGIVFIVHGLPKLLSPGNFAGFFGHIGLPVPLFSVLVVGVVETVGGLALMVGRGTRLAAGLLSVNMVGAIVFAKRSMGFVNGWELDFILLAACLSVFLSPAASKDRGWR